MLLGVLKPWNPWLRPSHLPANVFQGLLEESLAQCPRECVWLLVPSSHKNPLNVLYGQILPAFPPMWVWNVPEFHASLCLLYCDRLLPGPLVPHSFTASQFSYCCLNCLCVCLPDWSTSERGASLCCLIVAGTFSAPAPIPAPAPTVLRVELGISLRQTNALPPSHTLRL